MLTGDAVVTDGLGGLVGSGARTPDEPRRRQQRSCSSSLTSLG